MQDPSKSTHNRFGKNYRFNPWNPPLNDVWLKQSYVSVYHLDRTRYMERLITCTLQYNTFIPLYLI